MNPELLTIPNFLQSLDGVSVTVTDTSNFTVRGKLRFQPDQSGNYCTVTMRPCDEEGYNVQFKADEVSSISIDRDGVTIELDEPC